MRFFFLIILWSCTSGFLFAQEAGSEQRITEKGKNFILYKVQPGETLYSISRRYNVDIQKLSEVNPQLANGLKSGEVIKIPDNQSVNSDGEDQSDNKPSYFISHKVQRKETLYSISKKYGISIESILEFNPGITGLKKGETIQVPQWKNGKEKAVQETQVSDAGEGKGTFHIVREGETLYAISKKYGITLSSLLENNPDARLIKPGMRLIIPLKRTTTYESQPEVQNYLFHKIIKGETLYSISRKYHVSTDRLVEINPSLRKSCKAGSVIRIPSGEKKQITGKKGKTSDDGYHIALKGETLFEISQKYNIPVNAIVKKNPFLEKRIPRAGDTIFIGAVEKGVIQVDHEPVAENRPEVLKKGDCLPDATSSRGNQTFKVVMLLPLMITENKSLNAELISASRDANYGFTEVQSDTLRTATKRGNQLQFQGNSENFFHFYEGALLAIDSLQQMGIRVDLEVWDTEQKVSKVRSFVSSGILNKADLIIGPVYPNEQKEIADFVVKRKIPLISPLSPSDEHAKDNEFFFQVNPTREYTSEKTNEYVISTFRNSNVVVLQTSSSGNEAEDEVSKLKQELENNGGNGNGTTIRLCNFRKNGYASLREMMEKDRKNILLLLTTNEAEVSVVISNIKTIASGYDAIVVGNNRLPQFESIDPEHYHQGRLEFLTPYWPDMNQEVTRSFIRKFRVYFRTDPNQYSIQGYDVTFFFVKAMSDFGPDFRSCIFNEKAGLVQGTYHFSKLPSGGYVNKGLSVIQYLPSYEIVRKKIYTE